jgi:exopolysaccharide biosynthesis protein
MLLAGGASKVTWREELFDDASGIKPESRQPRTAVGVDAQGGVLFLLVADGRKILTPGLTLAQTASLLQEVGARQGINFDGGGSSTFAFEGRVLNAPSDGRERPVYSALCVR